MSHVNPRGALPHSHCSLDDFMMGSFPSSSVYDNYTLTCPTLQTVLGQLVVPLGAAVHLRTAEAREVAPLT